MSYASTTPVLPERKTFLLSELVGSRVYWRGKTIGKLDDFAIAEAHPLPHVKNMLVNPGFGDPLFLIPVDKVVLVEKGGIGIDLVDPEAFRVARVPENIVLVRDFILNKKVIDMEGREVSMVFDVSLLQVGKNFYLSEVDFGKRSLFRRLRLGWLANLLNIEDETVSWTWIQPLPDSLSSFKGNVTLNTLKDNIADIPPVDLADIIEELTGDQRTAVFSQLDTEDASDALEEIDPNVQREIIAELDPQVVARLINEMTAPQAADVLSAVPLSDRNDVLALVEEELRNKTQSIIDHQEDSILSYTTKHVIFLSQNETVGDVRKQFALLSEEKDFLHYLYVHDGEQHLNGVIDVASLLIAPSELPLFDVMAPSIVNLKPDDTLKDAQEAFQRYGYRALPVLDDERNLEGVILFKVVMFLKHRFVG